MAGLSWEEVGALCLAVASRHCDAPADAEDAAQDALLRAWNARERCASAADPVAYVAAVARNEALRGRDRRSRVAEVPMQGDVHPASEDAALLALVEIGAVTAALEHLTPDERTLLHLRYDLDLTQPKIAERLNVPEGTVKVRLHRARRKLRQAIEGPRRVA